VFRFLTKSRSISEDLFVQNPTGVEVKSTTQMEDDGKNNVNTNNQDNLIGLIRKRRQMIHL